MKFLDRCKLRVISKVRWQQAFALNKPNQSPNQILCFDCAEIFEAKQKKYKKRGSSGNWMPDRTTWAEEMAYKKEMGLKKGASAAR